MVSFFISVDMNLLSNISLFISEGIFDIWVEFIISLDIVDIPNSEFSSLR